MAVENNDTTLLHMYSEAGPEGRLQIMMGNYAVFPKLIRRVEKKVFYKITVEREYMRSLHRGELGVRIQTSGISDITADEAIDHVTVEEAIRTGKYDRGLIRDLENADEYETAIRTINVMRLDYELLTEIIDDLREKDSKVIKQYLVEGKLFKEIADSEGKTYDAIKKRIERIRAEIRDQILDCLEMSCRGCA